MHKLDSVVIVGRANVGKSALFNKLTRSNAALCTSLDGTTRDYISGFSEDLNCTIIDTAGMGSGTVDYKNEICSQISKIVQDSDILLFVVDGKNGLDQKDFDEAKKIKKKSLSNKRIILVANKSENQNYNDCQFLSLGFGEPVFISALHSLGIEELKELIRKSILKDDKKTNNKIEESKKQNNTIIKVAIVGRPNAGKSSLINALLGFERSMVSDIRGTTRESITEHIDYKDKTIKISDTAGIRKTGIQKIERIERLSISNALKTIEKSDIVLLISDACEGIVSMQDLRLAKHAFTNFKPLILIANKWDLVEHKDAVEKHYEKNAKLLMNGAGLIKISAKYDAKINTIKKEICRLYNCYSQILDKQSLNEFISSDKINRAFTISGKNKIKSKYIVQTSAKPPTFKVFINTSYEAPEQYKRYIANNIRERYKMFGVPININVCQSKNPFFSTDKS